MKALTIDPTGNIVVDRTLQALVDAFETGSPNRVYGYYSVGSYADQSALTMSVVDIIVVVQGGI